LLTSYRSRMLRQHAHRDTYHSEGIKGILEKEDEEEEEEEAGEEGEGE
jgi:hypothetical protein